MAPSTDLPLLVFLALGLVVLIQLWQLYAHVACNSLKALRGPVSPSFLLGYAWLFWTTDPTELHEEWVALYGRTFQYRILSYICLFTVDPKAIAHILARDDVYQKPRQVRTFIAQMLGNGVLLKEGEQHRRQKRVVNPAFGHIQIREFTDLFFKKAFQVCVRHSASTLNSYCHNSSATSFLSSSPDMAG
ncbi:hypothetical protein C8Q77DRAFT_632506 [Trametes polyzona]|nr:hypothetical protein C8Q77DRAFT_632506 [Trametes polyzona]